LLLPVAICSVLPHTNAVCPQVSRLGVCSVLVPTSVGLCLKTFKEGLDKFAAQQQQAL